METNAMIASATYQNTGISTPLFHIASVFIDPKALLASTDQAMVGSPFSLDLGTAVVGLSIHMVFGMALGLVLTFRTSRAPR